MIVLVCVVFRKNLSDLIYSKTEPERHRLEVEYVAKQSNEWIKTHLEGVRAKRGELAYKRLRQDVLKLWKK